jgi:large subunit ribosomal protein L10
MASPKPSGFSNTKPGKEAIIVRTKALIETSNLIISLPIAGVSKEQIDFLRKDLPSTVKASVVKNTLMKVALKDSTFEPLAETINGENMFFFIPEGDSKATYAGFKKWRKEYKRLDAAYDLQFAAMENVLYPTAAIEAVTALPTKKELITKIAMGIKAVPTKLGKGIKGVPNKLGRAVNALKIKLEEEEAAANKPVVEEAVV